jgi:hypothetical protein
MKRTNPLAAAGETITLRADPVQTSRDFSERTIVVRAASIDEAARSVEVTLCTENPVNVYAPGYGSVDEVLIADGAQFPAQLPLLETHNRFSLDAVLGSVRQIRRDGATWVGRAYFAEGNARADAAWNMVRQGHLTDVSLGYKQTRGEEIPPGQTRTVAAASSSPRARRARCSSPPATRRRNCPSSPSARTHRQKPVARTCGRHRPRHRPTPSRARPARRFPWILF